VAAGERGSAAAGVASGVVVDARLSALPPQAPAASAASTIATVPRAEREHIRGGNMGIPRHPDRHAGWTRARLLRAAVAGGAVAAGGAVMGAGRDDDASLAAPSKSLDADILNLFLSLEFVQEGFYRAALEMDRLDGDLLTFATTVGGQERQHVAFLTAKLGGRAAERRQSDFGDLVATAERFRDAAIELEEAAIAAYIGQAANLTRSTLAAVATLLSVEARQAAWIRDLGGTSPAPRAADPARKPRAILDHLRERGFIG
jgi:ferritin-like protein